MWLSYTTSAQAHKQSYNTYPITTSLFRNRVDANVQYRIAFEMLALLFIFGLGCLLGHVWRELDLRKGVLLPVVVGLAAVTAWNFEVIVNSATDKTYVWSGYWEEAESDGLWYYDGRHNYRCTINEDGFLKYGLHRTVPKETRYLSDQPPTAFEDDDEGSGGWPYN